MKVGDLVSVTIETGCVDLGVILDVQKWTFSPPEMIFGHQHQEVYYEVMCQESNRICIATEDMMEVINDK